MSKTFLLCLTILGFVVAIPFVPGETLARAAIFTAMLYVGFTLVWVVRSLWRAGRRINFKTTRDA